MTHDDLLWLVKSSGRVLGPFPTAKIADLLRTREISILDEVSAPMRRWQTIQYHDEFREVVESLRRAHLSERTEASWTPGNSQLTQTLTDAVGGADLTDELTGSLDGYTDTAKEIIVHDLEEEAQGAPAPPSPGRYRPQFETDTAIRRQVEKTTRGLWVLTALVLAAAALFIAHRRLGTGGLRGDVSPATLKQTVVNLVQVGRYAEALREMKSYFGDGPQSGELTVYYAALLVQLEGQTLEGRRLFNTVLASKRPELKQAYVGIGLADLTDGDLDHAKENFERALAMDSEFVPALVNLADVSLQRGQYAAAKQGALRALKMNPSQGEALLAAVESSLFLYKNSGSESELTEAARRIRDFRARNWDYAGELDFYSLYFDFLRRQGAVVDRLQDFLDLDPRLTVDHRHNIFIYRGRATWKVLGRLCEQMAESLGGEPRVSALLASCFARESRWDSARKSIEKAVHQAPRDALIQAWYSHILRESGDADQASVVLGSATQANRLGEYRLPVLLQARFCQRAGLVDCARENWTRLFQASSDYLPAVAGLAWVGMENHSRLATMEKLNSGLKLSPDYIPLLEIKQRAETEGWNASN